MGNNAGIQGLIADFCREKVEGIFTAWSKRENKKLWNLALRDFGYFFTFYI